MKLKKSDLYGNQRASDGESVAANNGGAHSHDNGPRPAGITLLEISMVGLIAMTMTVGAVCFYSAASDEAASSDPTPFTSTDHVDQTPASYADMPLVGTLKRVDYLHEMRHRIIHNGLAPSRHISTSYISASVLTMEDGTQIIADGHVPAFGYGATVHKQMFEDRLLLSYCITTPVNECFAPGIEPLTPAHNPSPALGH